ncbi:MAG: HNH endonuclease [Saprospiraceae bacterium]|nr:HNH endonuclease [Saprospiraceae bacterium]
MKRKKIPPSLRNLVAERAAFRCEYCRILESDFYDAFQIDHIISQKHGGATELDNLAFSCPDCNRYKGSDIATFMGTPPVLTTLFNPRKEVWKAHFEVKDGLMMALTPVAEATIRLLRLNDPDRVILRSEMIKQNRFY